MADVADGAKACRVPPQDRRRDVSGAMAKLREAQLRRVEMANEERARALIPYQEAQLALDVFVALHAQNSIVYRCVTPVTQPNSGNWRPKLTAA